MHGHCAPVFAACRRDRGIDQPDDRHVQFVRNTEEKAEVLSRHVSRHCDDQAVARRGHRSPDLLELTADQIGRAQVLEAPVGQRIGCQLRPEAVMYPTRLYARVLERLQTCRELVVLE